MDNEKWLENKIKEYNKNPVETLQDILLSTNEVVFMALNIEINSEHTIKGVIKSCYENNINFLAKIGYLKNDEPN